MGRKESMPRNEFSNFHSEPVREPSPGPFLPSRDGAWPLPPLWEPGILMSPCSAQGGIMKWGRGC